MRLQKACLSISRPRPSTSSKMPPKRVAQPLHCLFLLQNKRPNCLISPHPIIFSVTKRIRHPSDSHGKLWSGKHQSIGFCIFFSMGFPEDAIHSLVVTLGKCVLFIWYHDVMPLTNMIGEQSSIWRNLTRPFSRA